MVVPKIESEKLIGHSIYEFDVGKLKDSLDNVGDHSLGVKEVTSMFGHFIKYRVQAEQTQERACKECLRYVDASSDFCGPLETILFCKVYRHLHTSFITECQSMQ